MLERCSKRTMYSPQISSRVSLRCPSVDDPNWPGACDDQLEPRRPQPPKQAMQIDRSAVSRPTRADDGLIEFAKSVGPPDCA